MSARGVRRVSSVGLRAARALDAFSKSLPPAVFPIADPDLAALSELLHRMTVCQEDTPATRYAAEAIRRLRSYVAKQDGSNAHRS